MTKLLRTGTFESNCSVYDILDLDFNNDGVIDASDLASITEVVESEEPAITCETNGHACDHADFNRDGDVNSDDITTFTAALGGWHNFENQTIDLAHKQWTLISCQRRLASNCSGLW